MCCAPSPRPPVPATQPAAQDGTTAADPGGGGGDSPKWSSPPHGPGPPRRGRRVIAGDSAGLIVPGLRPGGASLGPDGGERPSISSPSYRRGEADSPPHRPGSPIGQSS